VNRIGGEAERFKGEGAEQCRASDRSRGEERRALAATEPHPNLSQRIDDALAARELRLPIVQGTQLQLRHDVGR